MTDIQMIKYYYMIKRYHERDLDEYSKMIDKAKCADDLVYAMSKYLTVLQKIYDIEDEAIKDLVFLVQFTFQILYDIIII